MRLALALLLLLMFAGCYESIDHHETDASVDAAIDADTDASIVSGGGMAVSVPSPRDRKLELVVVAASLVVALAPVTAIRRRRRVLKERAASPPFS
jgi:hypothetical protein